MVRGVRRGEEAALLWGAAEMLRQQLRSPLHPSETIRRDLAMATARQALGEEALSRGHAMSLEQALIAALAPQKTSAAASLVEAPG